ncbi:MAG: response regulator [Parvularculaceae bacterium]|nr:response regulator [Parvularculaceae bacterium]
MIGAESRHGHANPDKPEWYIDAEKLAHAVYEEKLFITADDDAKLRAEALAASGEERLRRLVMVIEDDLTFGYAQTARELYPLFEQSARELNSARYMELLKTLKIYERTTQGDSLSAARDLETITVRSRDPYVVAKAATYAAYALADSGMPGRAFELIRKGFDAANLIDNNEELLSNLHGAWSYVAQSSGDSESAINQTRLYVDYSRRAGLPVDGVTILFNLAIHMANNDEFAAAREFAAMEWELARDSGLEAENFFAAYLCATIADAAHDFSQSEKCAREAVESPTPAEGHLPIARTLLAKALANLGRVGEARKIYSELDATIDPAAAPVEALGVQKLKAYIAAAEGRSADAMRYFEDFHRAHSRMQSSNFNSGVRELRASMEAELASAKSVADANAEIARMMAERVNNQRMMLLFAALLSVAAALAIYAYQRNARILAEARRSAEEANHAKTEFLALMSHELRTPLNGVLGMTAGLLSDEISGPQREKASAILDSGQTLLALLNDVLDLSKVEAGKLEVSPVDADFRETLDRVVKLFEPLAEDRGTRLIVNYDAGAPDWARFDPVRVRQCVTNLISNAVKFTSVGEIAIDVRAQRAEAGNVFAVTVRDTGIGMDEETLKRLFRPYSQGDATIARRFGGTGLGLAIAQRLARVMGGDVSAQSAVGEGTTMTFTFQAGPSQAPAPKDESENLIGDPLNVISLLHEKSVLIVDDVVVNRQVARLFVKPFGARIIEAQSGEEALDILNAEKVDLVLLDVQMPGIDGCETARRVRASSSVNADVAIIALTAGVVEGDKERCLDAGMNEFVAKPLDVRGLSSAIVAAMSDTTRSARRGAAA